MRLACTEPRLRSDGRILRLHRKPQEATVTPSTYVKVALAGLLTGIVVSAPSYPMVVEISAVERECSAARPGPPEAGDRGSPRPWRPAPWC